MQQEKGAVWYVLNYVPPTRSRAVGAAAVVERFNALLAAEAEASPAVPPPTPLEIFAPTFVESQCVGGHMAVRERPLVFHYVFLRGEPSLVKRFCIETPGFSFVLSRVDSGRYAILSDREMESFKTAARALSNRLPLLPLEGLDLEQGDLVEVMDGDFAGLIGIYLPRKRGNTGNIVVQASMSFATAVFDVRADHVRILRFAADTRRAYDQVDAFVPRLLKALRHFHADESLPRPDAAALSVFADRMALVEPDSRKFGAKLAALLLGADTLLGRMADAARDANRLDRCLDEVTNPATLALIHLVRGVALRRPGLIEEGRDLLAQTESEKPSKARARLAEEYQYYERICSKD